MMHEDFSFIEMAEKMLCPPGNGVYTIHTAKERKAELHAKLFNKTDDTEVLKSYKDSLKTIESSLKNKSQSPIILGLPSDSGGGIQRGANWGPLFVRLALHDLWDKMKNVRPIAQDFGDVRVIPHFLHDKYLSQSAIAESRMALYNDPAINLPVSPLSMATSWLDYVYSHYPEAKVFGLGGDHSVSYSFCRSYLLKQNRKNIKSGILHFDAHTDLLDKRMGVDICFGSWAFHARQWCHTPQALVQVGIRSSGKSKQHWEKELGVKQIWNSEFKEKALSLICDEIVEHFKKIEVQEVYISLDIDALDARYAGATGTPEINGMQPHEIAYIIENVATHFKITGADLVEVAPFVSFGNPSGSQRETTLNYAGLLAQKILETMNRP